jgi:hypothetical protein
MDRRVSGEEDLQSTKIIIKNYETECKAIRQNATSEHSETLSYTCLSFRRLSLNVRIFGCFILSGCFTLHFQNVKDHLCSRCSLDFSLSEVNMAEL